MKHIPDDWEYYKVGTTVGEVVVCIPPTTNTIKAIADILIETPIMSNAIVEKIDTHDGVMLLPKHNGLSVHHFPSIGVVVAHTYIVQNVECLDGRLSTSPYHTNITNVMLPISISYPFSIVRHYDKMGKRSFTIHFSSPEHLVQWEMSK